MLKKENFLFFLIIIVNYFNYGQIKDQDIITIKKDKNYFNPSNVIINHIIDSHEWHICGDGDNSIVIPLPIILWDNGLQIFMSYEFNHGEKIVKKSGNYYRIFNDKIYKTDASGFLYLNNLGNPVIKKILLDFSITKNVIVIICSVIILFIIFFHMRKSYKNHYMTWKFGKIIEPLILFIRDEVAIPNLGIKKYRKYLPFLLTIFFFILINNLIGLLPTAPNVTGNISVTLALSIITFIVVNCNASKDYWKHIFWMPNVPIGVRFLLAPIEIAGIFIRPMTLCIRLFINMTAGHIVILSFISLIFIFKSIFAASFSIPFILFISMLELLVAFLQAFIFTTLSALFIGMAIKNHENKTH